MNESDIRRLRDARITALTLHNVPLDDVGRLLESLVESGFEIEINVTRRSDDD